ncbi:winged helix-turn-helix transcriptional regulator [Micromonospora siamensis]|uniref:DNA-binding transcriptional regulator, HxlR family n=1 Tax=Micromonospora siamensis TaxID=299152 RepID=A0A1C5IIS7_9ACTN|nr:helix-turn-helix domain-containing protein [Micromonospora siamensis]SCG58184.1 DNA-binding transcriptional regulator, HxlR family [Micromonospora siamensis]
MTSRLEADAGPRTCDEGLARAFAFLGKRWNGVLLGTLAGGPAGFAELARALPGISESVLSDRLGELTRVGLVSRTVREGPPVGVSYQLTERGAALAPALRALTRWAHENLPAPSAGGC